MRCHRTGTRQQSFSYRGARLVGTEKICFCPSATSSAVKRVPNSYTVSYFSSIVEREERIARELDTSAKRPQSLRLPFSERMKKSNRLETSAPPPPTPPFTLRWYKLLYQLVWLSQFIVFQFPTKAAPVSLETILTIKKIMKLSRVSLFVQNFVKLKRSIS